MNDNNQDSTKSKKIRLAISTCPNDTFAFHGLMEREIDWCGLDFEIELLDIQQLNDGLMAGRFDVAKASFHAATLLADSMVVLPSGSALGFGVGPLLLAAADKSNPLNRIRPADPNKVLCPGELTTATMLYKLYYGTSLRESADGRCASRLNQRLFSDIMPALKDRAADFGVCIHEGRFTWQEQGLYLVEDLGTRWESETKCPLPLGGIVANRNLGDETIGKVQSVIRRSVEYGLAHPDQTIPTMRNFAQEFDDDVLMSHVDLYVNEWTVELGETGRQALAMLATQAHACGLVSTANSLEIFG